MHHPHDGLTASNHTFEAVKSSDGTPIEVQRLGVGPAVVVCHGSFSEAADWISFATTLATTHTVYLYDRRGRGGSPRVHANPTIEAEVDDLAAVVSLAGPGAAVLGHSFGGGCAIAYAARDRFAGPIIAYEPRHAIDGPVSAGHIPEIRRLLDNGPIEVALHAILRDVIGLPDNDIAAFEPSPLWQRMLETADSFPDEVRLLDSLTWRKGDLDGIAGPVWLLIGEDSPVLPADREGSLSEVLPKLQRVTLPEIGHFGYLSDPIALAKAVRQCLISDDELPMQDEEGNREQ